MSSFYHQVGDTLPNVYLYDGSPSNEILASEWFKGKRGIIFAVLGAFNPGCTQVCFYPITMKFKIISIDMSTDTFLSVLGNLN